MNANIQIIKAIGTGFALDLIGSTAFLITADSRALYFVCLAYDLVLTSLGAYLTTYFSHRSALRYALVMGVLAELARILFLALKKTHAVPAWYTAASLILLIPAAAVGGYLCIKLEGSPEAHRFGE